MSGLKFKTHIVHQFAHEVQAQPTFLHRLEIDVIARSRLWYVIRIERLTMIVNHNLQAARFRRGTRQLDVTGYFRISMFDDIGASFVDGHFDVKDVIVAQTGVTRSPRDKLCDL